MMTVVGAQNAGKFRLTESYFRAMSAVPSGKMGGS
jgi:chromosome condensin MukBEF MukE localization factor